MSAALKILVIRRDNIGDLVCTTPIFSALRQHYPDALICALVNSYNAPALARHPHVDRVFVYTKLKHRAPGQSYLRLLWQRLRMHWALKKIGFDYVLLPNAQPRLLRLARGFNPHHIVALGDGESPHQKITLLPTIRKGSEHETQAMFRLLEPLGIGGMPPSCFVAADPVVVDRAQRALGMQDHRPIIALHISARKPSQRWPVARFVALMQILNARHAARFVLLWAPGARSNPLHPGDDEKAQAILHAVTDLPILAYATHTLPELIGALAICDAVICSDGGAMHLAAGLGKPIVCLFGHSDAWRWHPWGTPYQLLQTDSKDVGDITVEAVAAAFEQLDTPASRHEVAP